MRLSVFVFTDRRHRHERVRIAVMTARQITDPRARSIAAQRWLSERINRTQGNVVSHVRVARLERTKPIRIPLVSGAVDLLRRSTRVPITYSEVFALRTFLTAVAKLISTRPSGRALSSPNRTP